ncbi:MAG: GNAT family N-acetyltransferase [Gammaproteobacteria bacterium]|nr:GNAT family N-acetyltransferase [Gammaproteobacteria bacterium]
MDILIEPYAPEHLDELVPMWRSSFEQGVGVTDPNPLEEQRAYFLEQVLPHNEVRVALRDTELVGFIAASSSEIDQLYVHPEYQGLGIGSELLRWAKENSGGRLTLFTFARNQGARAFYERKGFRIIARGFEEQWRLDDLQYEWNSR